MPGTDREHNLQLEAYLVPRRVFHFSTSLSRPGNEVWITNLPHWPELGRKDHQIDAVSGNGASLDWHGLSHHAHMLQMFLPSFKWHKSRHGTRLIHPKLERRKHRYGQNIRWKTGYSQSSLSFNNFWILFLLAQNSQRFGIVFDTISHGKKDKICERRAWWSSAKIAN